MDRSAILSLLPDFHYTTGTRLPTNGWTGIEPFTYRGDRELRGNGDARDALEGVAHDLPLGVELRRVRDVLPRAAPAAAVDRADRVDALRARLQQCRDLRVQEARVRALDTNADAIARRGEGHEDDAAVVRAPDPVASGRELVDRELERLGRAAGAAPAAATTRSAPAARLRYRSAPRAREAHAAHTVSSTLKRGSAIPEG